MQSAYTTVLAPLSPMKLLRVEVMVVIIQHAIQPTFCTTYPTVRSQQSRHLNQAASGSAREGRLHGQEEPNTLKIQPSRS